jgi:hypothetical protein
MQEQTIKTSIHPTLQLLISKYKHPLQLIKKREQKLLDYNRYKSSTVTSASNTAGPNGAVDKALEESASQYESLNAQLVEELPKWLELVRTYMEIVWGHVASVQAKVYEDVFLKLEGVWENVVRVRSQHDGRRGSISTSNTGTASANGRVVEMWENEMRKKCLGPDSSSGGGLDERIREMSTLERWRVEVWDGWVTNCLIRSEGSTYGASATKSFSYSHDDDQQLSALSHDRSDGDPVWPWDNDECTYNPSFGGSVRKRVVVQYEFQPELDGELELPIAGMELDVDWVGGRWCETGEGNEEWWHGWYYVKDSEVKMGWFPGSYVMEV